MKYRIAFRLGKEVFERAIDPRFYIEDLKDLGKAEVKIIKENIPRPEDVPSDEHCFHADVFLETDKKKEEILEILEFILDDGVDLEVIDGDEQDSNKATDKDETTSEVPASILENYKIETEEILSKLRSSLEELASSPDDIELINETFRSFHTLKGNTGLILSYGDEPNLKDIHEITHKAETVLQKARDEGRGLSQRQVEILQELVDRIDDLFLAFNEGKREDPGNVYDLLEELIYDKSSKGKEGNEYSDPSVGALMNVYQQYIPVFRDLCKKREINDDEKEFFRRSLITLHKVVSDSEFEDLKKAVKELERAFGNVDFTEFCNKLEQFIANVQEIQEKFAKKPQPPSTPKSKDIDTSKYVSKSGYLKVEESLVSDLMDIVGELSVFKEWIYIFANKLAREYGSLEASKELKDNIHRFRGLMDSLQRKVLEMRMVPVSSLFERFPKLVRDLSRMLGKRVSLRIEGGDTKLDKTIVEKIAEPMIHLIRNSVDHGIEPVEERMKLGKPESGEILISSFQEGGSVIIEVKDDGRGIDPKRIREKAVQRGLYTRTEIDSMSDEDVIQIIFQPGFTTKDSATELSGRGVGMDVVAKAIRSLGGDIKLETQVGLGTTVKLILPLTLAIRKILLFRIGDINFGIPAESVGEVLKVGKNQIKSLRGRKVIYHRKSVVDLVFLSEILGIESTTNGVITLLVDNYLSKAVVVDDVVSTIDTVVKPVPESLEAPDLISGVTILGDGSIVYVVEVLK